MTDADLRAVADITYVVRGLFAKDHEIRVRRASGMHRGLTRCLAECLTCNVVMAEQTPWPAKAVYEHTHPNASYAVD